MRPLKQPLRLEWIPTGPGHWGSVCKSAKEAASTHTLECIFKKPSLQKARALVSSVGGKDKPRY